MIFNLPPQSGPCWKSISNTHLSSLATHQLGSSEQAVGEYPLVAGNVSTRSRQVAASRCANSAGQGHPRQRQHAWLNVPPRCAPVTDARRQYVRRGATSHAAQVDAAPIRQCARVLGLAYGPKAESAAAGGYAADAPGIPARANASRTRPGMVFLSIRAGAPVPLAGLPSSRLQISCAGCGRFWRIARRAPTPQRAA